MDPRQRYAGATSYWLMKHIIKFSIKFKRQNWSLSAIGRGGFINNVKKKTFWGY